MPSNRKNFLSELVANTALMPTGSIVISLFVDYSHGGEGRGWASRQPRINYLELPAAEVPVLHAAHRCSNPARRSSRRPPALMRSAGLCPGLVCSAPSGSSKSSLVSSKDLCRSLSLRWSCFRCRPSESGSTVALSRASIRLPAIPRPPKPPEPPVS